MWNRGSHLGLFYLNHINMDSIKLGKNPPVSDTGERRVEGIVPASHASTSCEGLSAVSKASTAEENAIAKEPTGLGEVKIIKNFDILEKAEITIIEPTQVPSIISNERIKIKLEKMDNIVEDNRARPKRGRKCKNTKSKEGVRKTDTGNSESERSAKMTSAKETSDDGERGEKKNYDISPRKGKRRKVSYKIDSSDEEETWTEDLKKRLTWEQMNVTDKETVWLEGEHVVGINSRILEYLKELDNLRINSRNIKGPLSGKMSTIIESIKRASNALAERVNLTEDPILWKNKATELESENLHLKRRLEILELKVRTLEGKNTTKLKVEQNDKIIKGIGKEMLRNEGYISKNMRVAEGQQISEAKEMGNLVVQTMENYNKGFNNMIIEMKQFFSESYNVMRQLIPQATQGKENNEEQRNIRIQGTKGKPTNRYDKHKKKGKKLDIIDKESESFDPRSSDFPSNIEEDDELRQTASDRETARYTFAKFRHKSINKSNTRRKPLLVEDSLSNYPKWELKEDEKRSNDRVEQEMEGWSKIQGRKRRTYANVTKQDPRRMRGQMSPTRILKRKLPQTAVISITCGQEKKYAEVLRKARTKVDIEKIGIDHIKAKRAITGGLLLEIMGKEAKEKAETLVIEMRKALKDEEVKVVVPQKRVELRLSGFDDSVSIVEIIEKLAEIGRSHPDDFRHGEVKKFRGLGSLWMRCPLGVALEILERHKNNKIKIGWCSVEIELLKNRPMQCYKCLAIGHPIQRCPSKINNMGKCNNCGEEGHHMKSCQNKPRCLVCIERGLDAQHRVGTERCRNYPPKSI